MEKYVVLDLEMCTVPKHMRDASYRYANEIIQIGAVLLDEDLKTIDEFSTFVAPQKGYLTGFISELTGITQRDLSGAPVFEEAIERFLNWFPDDARLVTWSTTDESQLSREAISKGVFEPKLFYMLENVIDCQRMFGDMIGIGRPYKLEEALYISDICLDGRLHDGLIDARNTAQLFIKMKTETSFRFNEYYEEARSEDVAPLCSSLGGLLAGLTLAG